MFSTLMLSGFLHFLQTAVFSVGYISGTQLFPEPLSSNEEKLCLEKMKQGDEEARNLLIERNLRLVAHICKKYRNSNVFLNEPIGKDKDDNVVTLQEVLENDERSVEDSVDLKFKIKLLYDKMKSILKDRERTILELRFGLDGHKPKTQIEIAQSMGISRSYVSRIETKAIGKLAKELKE